MAQIFHPSTNTIAKVSIFGGVFILAGAAVSDYGFVLPLRCDGVGVLWNNRYPF